MAPRTECQMHPAYRLRSTGGYVVSGRPVQHSETALIGAILDFITRKCPSLFHSISYFSLPIFISQSFLCFRSHNSIRDQTVTSLKLLHSRHRLGTKYAIFFQGRKLRSPLIVKYGLQRFNCRSA